MTIELLRGSAPPGECSYLPEETASLYYRYLLAVSDVEFEAMLSRGWRRQGACFFRPGCPQCRKCRSLRVDVAAFTPTKSQRRCRRRNDDVRFVVREPRITQRHLDIFNAWHADRHIQRGWRRDTTTAQDYSRTFLAGRFPFAREFAYYRGSDLIGVGLVDATPEALSSIYFYYHPEWRSDGPGTYSALCELDYAKETGRRWLYLGYWIPENASMSYKNRFGPHEILERYIGDDETPVWRKADPTELNEGAAEPSV